MILPRIEPQAFHSEVHHPCFKCTYVDFFGLKYALTQAQVIKVSLLEFLFSIHYTAAAAVVARRLIFGVNALRKPTPARFTKFAGYFHWGVSFSGTEISLILKNKMAAVGISLKII